MKKTPANGGGFVQRWLSRTSGPYAAAGYESSDAESSSAFSPPPLTHSSSTSASSSVIHTPKDSPAPIPRKSARSRYAVVQTPATPPTRYTELPPVKAVRKLPVSLPPHAQPSNALVLAQPSRKLHRLLNFHPMRSPIIYDISSPPSFITQAPSHTISRRHVTPPPGSGTSSSLVSDQDLSQYATTPPVTQMHIVSDQIPWSIHVRARHTVAEDTRPYVRVLDVIEGIYNSLRFGVSKREWDETPKQFRDHVKRAYLDRCVRARAYSLVGYEEKQGVRRVDWFLDNTMFSGLTVVTPEQGKEGAREGDNNPESRWNMIVAPRQDW